jgi:anti-sigma regulatory factor (Ser/Thr protein kinase)
VVTFCVISNRASFFQEIHGLCRRTSTANVVSHVSDEMWTHVGDKIRQSSNFIIVDPVSAFPPIPEQISSKAFAAVQTVCQNSDSSKDWQDVSRSGFVLWLREVSPMSDNASITEEVVMQSQHVRLAQLKAPMCCRLIGQLRERLMRGLTDYHVVSETRQNHFCMALEEALNNAFYHGNLELNSDLKEDGSSRFVELAAEREQLSPWCKRSVEITELVSEFGLWLTIHDDGKGFDVAAAFERLNDPELMLASGRGLMMMRAFADEMFYNVAGNEVTLVLYADGQDRELPLGTSSSSGTERRHIVA